MTTPIRTKGINKAVCPSKASDKCWEPRSSFEIKVECKGLGPPRPIYVHIYNLEPCESLIIERIYSDRCDPLYSPLKCLGNDMCLTAQYPDTVLTVPGTYRFSTASGNLINNDDFAYEQSEIHPEYAQLWLQQQALCCCAHREH